MYTVLPVRHIGFKYSVVYNKLKVELLCCKDLYMPFQTLISPRFLSKKKLCYV